MIKFHSVYEKLSQALDGFPSDALEVSDEIKEQVLSFNFSYLWDCFFRRAIFFKYDLRLLCLAFAGIVKISITSQNEDAIEKLSSHYAMLPE